MSVPLEDQPFRWLAIFLILTLCLFETDAWSQSASEIVHRFDFSDVVNIARDLAKKPQVTPREIGGKALADLSYDEYRQIRFRPERALWHDRGLFEIQFYHPGFLFRLPVEISEVVDGKEQAVPFVSSHFQIEPSVQRKLTAVKVNNYAGLKVTYPLHQAVINDDVAVFLGASYFRLVGRGDQFGISARGLAVDTAEPGGEEFPYFTKFWLVRPGKTDNVLTLFALLESASATGAYKFLLHPGKKTTVDCTAQLFVRTPGKKLGVAPLTSMYLRGENEHRGINDFRPEIHDSDGLVMHMGSSDENLFRPLANPRSGVRVSQFLDSAPRGFGLVQRDRRFENYLDLETHHEERPDLWVEPQNDWGAGSVELVEIASDFETNDNIVAYWVPRDRSSDEYHFEYRLVAGRRVPLPRQAVVVRDFNYPIASDEDSDITDVRRFVLDFRGEDLKGLGEDQPLHAEISLTNGNFRDLTIIKDTRTGEWRVTFVATRKKELASDMRLNLMLHGEVLSETWLYLWDDQV